MTNKSLIDSVTTDLSPFAYSVELQACVAQVGFDWPTVKDIFAKLQEEIAELETEVAVNQQNSTRILDEFGDILFCCANLARHLKVDPELALTHANQKFSKRFRAVEQLVNEQHKTMADLSFTELLKIWEIVKKQEK